MKMIVFNSPIVMFGSSGGIFKDHSFCIARVFTKMGEEETKL
jgi:hypothetical protein